MKFPAQSTFLRGLSAAAAVLALLAMLTLRPLHAQSSGTTVLLDWIEVKDSGGLDQQLRSQLNKLTEFFVRVTSPDVPRQSRRIWKISADGSQTCVMSDDTGVRYPRWGAGGYVLYLQEADTNKDGRIDFNDDFLIRVVSSSGGTARTVAQGKSAVWSPNGRFIAFVRDGRIFVANMQGEILPLGSGVPAGKLIATDSRNPAAHNFWAVDAQNEAKETLPEDLTKKYLWIGALSPSGSKIVFVNTMKTGLEVRDAQNENSTKEIVHGNFHFLDPVWSSDEKQIVYVSDRPPAGAPCGR